MKHVNLTTDIKDYKDINKIILTNEVRYFNCGGYEVILNETIIDYLVFDQRATEIYLN